MRKKEVPETDLLELFWRQVADFGQALVKGLPAQGLRHGLLLQQPQVDSHARLKGIIFKAKQQALSAEC